MNARLGIALAAAAVSAGLTTISPATATMPVPVSSPSTCSTSAYANWVSATPGSVWVSTGAAIGRSTNAGATWTWTCSGFGSWPRVDAVDTQHAWAIGASVRSTADGGATWQQAVLPPTPPVTLRSIDAADADHVWAYAEEGWEITTPHLFRTSDGMHWEEVDVPPSMDVLDISFADVDHGWLAGSRDGVWTTSDGGTTWTLLPVPGAMVVENVVRVDADRGYAVAKVSDFRWAVFSTSDGGLTWRRSDLAVRILAATGPDSAVAVGTSPSGVDAGWTIANVTRDGGRTWLRAHAWSWMLGHPSRASAAGNDVWVAGGDGVVFHSVDGGLTWAVVPIGLLPASRV